MLACSRQSYHADAASSPFVTMTSIHKFKGGGVIIVVPSEGRLVINDVSF